MGLNFYTDFSLKSVDFKLAKDRTKTAQFTCLLTLLRMTYCSSKSLQWFIAFIFCIMFWFIRIVAWR